MSVQCSARLPHASHLPTVSIASIPSVLLSLSLYHHRLLATYRTFFPNTYIPRRCCYGCCYCGRHRCKYISQFSPRIATIHWRGCRQRRRRLAIVRRERDRSFYRIEPTFDQYRHEKGSGASCQSMCASRIPYFKNYHLLH